MIKRPVESGWGGDAVVCADSVGSDRGGSSESAQHDSVHRSGANFFLPTLSKSTLLTRHPIEAA
jgi:hypothetical protein